MKLTGNIPTINAGFALALLFMLVPTLALAQDVFEAPTSFLEDIQTFVTGAGGILLGGVAIAVTAIGAASPRTNITWGNFFLVLVVICIFFGAFQIAEVLQEASTG